MSLESMRRGFIGGVSLALFIDIPSLGQPSCTRDLEFLASYLPIEEMLLTQIPWWLHPLVRPFTDYHFAAVAFYETAKELCEAKGELYCQGIWETNEELVAKLE